MKIYGSLITIFFDVDSIASIDVDFGEFLQLAMV